MVDHRTHSTATKPIPLLLWRGKSLLASKNARNNSNSWGLGSFVCALELARIELYCTPKVYIRSAVQNHQLRRTREGGSQLLGPGAIHNLQFAGGRCGLRGQLVSIADGIVVSSVFGVAVLTKKEIRRSRRVSGWIVDVRLFR